MRDAFRSCRILIFSTFESSSFRSMSGKRDSHFYIAKTRGLCAVPGTHGLHGLSFAAIRRAPQSPIFFAANCVATVPEFRADAAVTRALQQANFFPSFHFPVDLRGK